MITITVKHFYNIIFMSYHSFIFITNTNFDTYWKALTAYVMVTIWTWNDLYRLVCWMLGSQRVALVWNMMKLLGSWSLAGGVNRRPLFEVVSRPQSLLSLCFLFPWDEEMSCVTHVLLSWCSAPKHRARQPWTEPSETAKQKQSPLHCFCQVFCHSNKKTNTET